MERNETTMDCESFFNPPDGIRREIEFEKTAQINGMDPSGPDFLRNVKAAVLSGPDEDNPIKQCVFFLYVHF